MKRLGLIGWSAGNGHPFSFSAIINGFSPEGLANSGWPVIYEYVRRRHASEIGLPGLRITHAWTQDPEVTRQLCAACLIQHAVEDPRDLLGQVDGVIIARDDHESHYEMARPFLEAGLPVFVDKPLSLRLEELRAFRPFLEKGQLMSCSGMRYARELDEVRADLAQFGTIRLWRGAILLSWEKYGVHLLEAILGLVPARPLSVRMNPTAHASGTILLDDGAVLQIDALGDCPRTFRVEVFGTKKVATCEITDNFSMFRRMLWEFGQMVQAAHPVPAIPPERTLDVLRTLIAGLLSRESGREVRLDELHV